MMAGLEVALLVASVSVIQLGWAAISHTPHPPAVGIFQWAGLAISGCCTIVGLVLSVLGGAFTIE